MRITNLLLASVFTMTAAAWTPVLATPSSPEALMREGIDEFRAGAFAPALDKFLQARAAGLDTPVLRYDLGAVYFKLQRDDEAAAQFKSLLEDPKFSDFARYNLGLIAQRAGRTTDAQRYFTAVETQSRNAQLRLLARSNLRGKTVSSHPWQGYVQVGGGYDDNVALAAPSSLLSASGVSSPAINAQGGGAVQLTGNRGQGLQLAGNLYDVQYPRQSNYNLIFARLGPEYRMPLGSWRVQSGGYFSEIRLGGNELEKLGSLNLRAQRSLAGSTALRFDYWLERATGGLRYAYLTGWQNKFAVQTSWHPGPVQVSAEYGVAINRRQNLSVGTQFFSASPTRQHLEARLRWEMSPANEIYVRGRYGWNRYDQSNVFLQAGAPVVLRRQDTVRDAELGYNYRLTLRGSLNASYEYRRNDSNIARYAYGSNRYMLAYTYVF
jgi:tetratricopeptide (TPR) repeat protein